MLEKYTLSAVIAALAAAAWPNGIHCAEPQGKRTILERHDQSAVEGKEIISGTAELPPGASIGWHVHPGDEVGIILEGSLIMHVRGQADRELRAGDHYFTPRGVVHSVSSAPGAGKAVAFSTWVVDKGKPLAEPAD